MGAWCLPGFRGGGEACQLYQISFPTPPITVTRTKPWKSLEALYHPHLFTAGVACIASGLWESPFPSSSFFPPSPPSANYPMSLQECQFCRIRAPELHLFTDFLCPTKIRSSYSVEGQQSLPPLARVPVSCQWARVCHTRFAVATLSAALGGGGSGDGGVGWYVGRFRSKRPVGLVGNDASYVWRNGRSLFFFFVFHVG